MEHNLNEQLSSCNLTNLNFQAMEQSSPYKTFLLHGLSGSQDHVVLIAFDNRNQQQSNNNVFKIMSTKFNFYHQVESYLNEFTEIKLMRPLMTEAQ